ncbi:MAG: hypothetical protein FWF79_01905, partial [Defluviitaleaceae bacterium]|nr:hypothetical protein [Defluviitaleaceae bacterium]
PRQSFALQNFATPLGKGVTPPSQANNLVGGVISGRLSVTVFTSPAEVSYRIQLAALITDARRLLHETAESPDGFGVPVGVYWAYPGAHETLREAVNAAEDVLYNKAFSYGDTFYVTVHLDDNPGFAAMLLRLHVPAGLELTGITHHAAAHPDNNFLDGILMPENLPRAGNIFAGWAGRGNLYGDGALFTYSFRVTGTTAAELPITLAFANYRGTGADALESPTNLAGQNVPITLPGGVTWQNIATIATISITDAF